LQLQANADADMLAIFSCKLFTIICHSRGIESIFSIMGYITTRNSMSVNTLELLTKLKRMLLESEKHKSKAPSKVTKQKWQEKSELKGVFRLSVMLT
jgi:hypothetical protein